MGGFDLYVECEFCDDEKGPQLGVADSAGHGACYPCAEDWDLSADDEDLHA